MMTGDPGQSALFCPPAVTVHDDGDMSRNISFTPQVTLQ
jgi:hypothetical protein